MDNKAIALDFFKAADNNDFSTVEKLFGRNHHFYSSMSPMPMDAAQHLGLLNAFQTGFSNTRHEILDIFESGNKVVIRGIWHGLHSAAFNNIPASGKTVRLSFICIIEIENNEMLNQWIELDSMVLMMQIGAIPSPQ